MGVLFWADGMLKHGFRVEFWLGHVQAFHEKSITRTTLSSSTCAFMESSPAGACLESLPRSWPCCKKVSSSRFKSSAPVVHPLEFWAGPNNQFPVQWGKAWAGGGMPCGEQNRLF